LKSDATDEFYNIGMGTQTTIRELCELILEVTEADFEIEYEPAGQTFVMNRVGSTDKARRGLGFEAKVDLREGLTRLIEWRKHHKASSRKT
jgi:UDP-glucose 4-epimerase